MTLPAVLVLFLAADSAPPAGKAPKWPLPWAPEVPHVYQWYMTTASEPPGPEPNGTTTFTLQWDRRKQAIISKGDLNFRTKGSALRGRFFTLFDPDLKPVLYVSRFAGTTAGRRTGAAGVNAAFGPKTIRIRLGTSSKSPVEKLPAPKVRYWLYGHQAIQHWAVFCSTLKRTEPSTITVIVPDILRFVRISFTPDGTEEIRGTKAFRLKFQAEGLFNGTVWIGPNGRLLRYRQVLPNGTLNIWLKAEEAKGKK